MTNIEITYGDETKVFEPGRKITIGRSEESTIHIDHKQVSRYHSQIVYEDALGAWIFSDLGSANSSIIDGEEVKTKQLLGPQTIKLGFYDGAPTLHTLVRIDSTELDDATIVVNRSDLNDTTESQIFEMPALPTPQPVAEPSSIQIPAPVTVPLTPAPEPKVQTERKFCPRCGTNRVGNFCGGCGFDYRQ